MIINMKSIFYFLITSIVLFGCSALFVAWVENIADRRIAYHETQSLNIEEYHSPAPAFFTQSPEEGLIEALEFYEIQFPEIVYAQALLETGHFTSRVCKEYNNLFGLYNSKTKDYYKFDHWSDSVKAYVDFIQYKYKEGDYYQFLIDLPYAEDPNYINKIKSLEKYYGRDFKTINEYSLCCNA